MKKKNFLYFDNKPFDSDNEFDEDDDLNIIENINSLKSIVVSCPHQNVIVGIINTSYIFHDRLFCVKNNGILKLQQRWRETYKKKIQRYSNPRNIRHREIYGKFQLGKSKISF